VDTEITTIINVIFIYLVLVFYWHYHSAFRAGSKERMSRIIVMRMD